MSSPSTATVYARCGRTAGAVEDPLSRLNTLWCLGHSTSVPSNQPSESDASPCEHVSAIAKYRPSSVCARQTTRRLAGVVRVTPAAWARLAHLSQAAVS
jgi:hypothetical protein